MEAQRIEMKYQTYIQTINQYILETTKFADDIDNINVDITKIIMAAMLLQQSKFAELLLIYFDAKYNTQNQFSSILSDCKQKVELFVNQQKYISSFNFHLLQEVAESFITCNNHFNTYFNHKLIEQCENELYGKHYIASEDISPGTILIIEPSFLVGSDVNELINCYNLKKQLFKNLLRIQIELNLNISLKDLESDQLRGLFGESIEEKLNKNNFTPIPQMQYDLFNYTKDFQQLKCVYLKHSIFNHQCYNQNNVNIFFVGDVCISVSNKQINKNDQIFISYAINDQNLLLQKYQQYLKYNYSFSCICDQCSKTQLFSSQQTDSQLIYLQLDNYMLQFKQIIDSILSNNEKNQKQLLMLDKTQQQIKDIYTALQIQPEVQIMNYINSEMALAYLATDVARAMQHQADAISAYGHITINQEYLSQINTQKEIRICKIFQLNLQKKEDSKLSFNVLIQMLQYYAAVKQVYFKNLKPLTLKTLDNEFLHIFQKYFVACSGGMLKMQQWGQYKDIVEQDFQLQLIEYYE